MITNYIYLCVEVKWLFKKASFFESSLRKISQNTIKLEVSLSDFVLQVSQVYVLLPCVILVLPIRRRTPVSSKYWRLSSF